MERSEDVYRRHGSFSSLTKLEAAAWESLKKTARKSEGARNLSLEELWRIFRTRPSDAVGVFSYGYSFKKGEWQKRLKNNVMQRLERDTGLTACTIRKRLPEIYGIEYTDVLRELLKKKNEMRMPRAWKTPGELYGKRFGLFTVKIGSYFVERNKGYVVGRCTVCKAERRFNVVTLIDGRCAKTCENCKSSASGAQKYGNAARLERTKEERTRRTDEFKILLGLSWFSIFFGQGGCDSIYNYVEYQLNDEAREIWKEYHGETL